MEPLHHRVYDLNDHLVLVTKYRRRALSSAMPGRFRSWATERCGAWGGRLTEGNGEPDHGHLLFTLPPTRSLPGFVKALKTGSSGRLRSEFPQDMCRWSSDPVLWSRSYCVISAGGAPLGVLRRDIEGQARAED